MQRLIAAIGILALTLTALPALPDGASVSLGCCNGIMCPMHTPEPNENCAGNGAALRPCPAQCRAVSVQCERFRGLDGSAQFQGIKTSEKIVNLNVHFDENFRQFDG